MCGIVGYVGRRRAQDVLLKGLSRLEYRGYDSAGIAVIKGDQIVSDKKAGKLRILVNDLKTSPIEGTTGIGHTRWATHGIPNERNAHPHFDCKRKIALVHNGIIENYHELKQDLLKEGHKFTSETDTEVIAHLIEKYYKGRLEDAVMKALKRLRGSFAIGVIHKDEPQKVVGARSDSPLIVGLGKGENFLASDAPAIIDYTKDVIFLDNHELIVLTPDSVVVKDFSGRKLNKKPTKIKWDISQAEKGGYSHFMLKEIFEQGFVLDKIIDERVERNNNIEFDELKINKGALKRFKNIAIVACGTAYHAGLTGRYMIEELAKVPCWVDTSSEFRYRDPMVGRDTLVIIVSQSGETADSLAALREAKRKGATVLGICNVVGSSIAREADGVIFTHAGPEIAVASTKAYTAQLAIFYLFTLYLARIRRAIHPKKHNYLIGEFRRVPKLVDELVDEYKPEYNNIAAYAQAFKRYYHEKHNKSCFLYLARSINCPNALEGALKLKEISYISAEGYPAGEMKHGPIALIDENPWVVCIATKSRTYEKMLSNIQEVKARGGIVIAIVTEGDKEILQHNVNYMIEIPDVEELFSPLLVVIPLQLLAFYVAREFNYDIDQPRNLAKSVTVE
jgi:glutamine---fructose-6-phosphate transaminase (isomerizing)